MDFKSLIEKYLPTFLDLIVGFFSKEEVDVTKEKVELKQEIELKVLTLKRLEFREDGIFSELSEHDKHLFYTLEHSYNLKPKIPNGLFRCKRRLSPHFGYEVFEVLNVPNCSFIEIHPGNKNDQSNGCILIGEKITTFEGVEMVTNSKYSFTQFMDSFKGINEFNLQVID